MPDITLVHYILHPVFGSLCTVALLSDRFPPTLLFSTRVPYICHVSPLCRALCSCTPVIEGVDIDANVFTHQTNTERMSKPTNFEGLSVHFSANTRQIYVIAVS